MTVSGSEFETDRNIDGKGDLIDGSDILIRVDEYDFQSRDTAWMLMAVSAEGMGL